MVEFRKLDDSADIQGYQLVEGLPGIGLVARITTDFLIEELNMSPHAEVFNQDLPDVAMFGRNEPGLNSPVRVFRDDENEIAVLKSDAPISAESSGFVKGLLNWIDQNNLKPIFQVGLPVEVDEREHYLFHVKSGDFETSDAVELPKPPVAGGVAGPTGMILQKTLEKQMNALGLVVESDPQFPDPAASRVLIEEGLKPLTGIDVDTGKLQDSAEEIKKQKKYILNRLKESGTQKSSEAYPREMYQ